MPLTFQEIYTQVTYTLSSSERLRLATLILNDLVKQDAGVQDSVVIDESDVWTEQDQIDLASFSLQYYATMTYPDSPEIPEQYSIIKALT